MIHSLRSGEVGAIAPFRYAGIVWSILLGYLIWRQLPDAVSLTGISILVSAGLYTFYRQQQLRRRKLQREALVANSGVGGSQRRA